MVSIRSIIVSVFSSSIRLIDLFIPKRKNQFLFSGPQFKGNTRYLFEHLVSDVNLEYRDFNLYWLTRSLDETKYINSKFNKVFAYNILSLKGIFIFLRSKYLFLTHGASDYFYFIGKHNPKKFIINLWHGTPIKKMDKLVPNSKIQWNLMTSGSKYESLSYKSISNIDFSKIIISGHPRTQYLYDSNLNIELKKEIQLNILKTANLNFHQIILYAPTYRKHVPTKLFPFNDFNITDLQNHLAKFNILLIIKMHPYEKILHKSSFEFNLVTYKTKNMIVVDDDISSSMEDFLLISDLLITDYSSSFFDFLILKKPTFFIPYDYEEYKNFYGFSLDYINLISNQFAETYQDFIKLIETNLKSPEVFQKDILLNLSKYHQYNPSKVYDTIMKEVIEN